MGPVPDPRSLAGASLPDGVRLGEAVARGASGTVYRGWHPTAGTVAVKVSHADDDWNALRLMREANAAAAIDDPAVVRVAAAGRLDDGRAWVAMEWIDGVTLEDALGARRERLDAPLRGSLGVRGGWPAAKVLGVAAQLARALTSAHAVGVVHRDLKPSNIMVRRDGRIVIVDWGIAWRAGDPASSASRCAGTPHYMAPEQALGEGADARADLYSLGCVLVRMWTGRVPFEGSSVEVMLAHLGAPPPTLEGAPPALAALVAQLMAKRPDDRPSSAAEVADILERLASENGVDPFGPTVAVPTLRRPARSRRLAIGFIAVAGLALGLGSFSAVRALRFAPATAVASVGTAWAQPQVLPPPVLPPAAPAQDPVAVLVDGGLSMRATLRSAPIAGGKLDVALELWDEDDAPITGTQLAATLRTPGGETVALSVPGKHGLFSLGAAVERAGEYVLTVFAPSGETTFSLRLAVGARPSS